MVLKPLNGLPDSPETNYCTFIFDSPECRNSKLLHSVCTLSIWERDIMELNISPCGDCTRITSLLLKTFLSRYPFPIASFLPDQWAGWDMYRSLDCKGFRINIVQKYHHALEASCYSSYTTLSTTWHNSCTVPHLHRLFLMGKIFSPKKTLSKSYYYFTDDVYSKFRPKHHS